MSYRDLGGTISVLKEDKIMYQTGDIDGLVKVSTHAVFYIFHGADAETPTLITLASFAKSRSKASIHAGEWHFGTHHTGGIHRTS